MATYPEDVKFSVECTMRARWVPQFLGMLRRMQCLGSAGSSRNVTMFADGDGDFRPKFSWAPDLPSPADPATDDGGDQMFDAG